MSKEKKNHIEIVETSILRLEPNKPPRIRSLFKKIKKEHDKKEHEYHCNTPTPVQESFSFSGEPVQLELDLKFKEKESQNN
jgi:hypothetical protein